MPHIVIDVPEPTRTLYLAKALVSDNHIHYLEKALTESSKLHSLEIKCCTHFATSACRDAFDAMIRDISAARIFAGILAAESDSAGVNLDVIYQVGFARSRAKVIILFAPAEMEFPIYFDHCYLFRYNSADFESSDFQGRVNAVVENALNDAGAIGIISSSFFPNTWSSLYHNWLNNPDFIEDFMETMRVAHDAARLLQKITHAQVDPLLRLVDDIVAMNRCYSSDSDSQRALERRGENVRAAWRQYIVNYHNNYLPFLKTLVDRAANARSVSLDSMAKSALVESEPIIRNCQRRVASLSAAIERYVDEIETTTIFFDNVLDDICIQPHTTLLVSGRLTTLSSAGKSIMIKAVQLQHSLLQLPL